MSIDCWPAMALVNISPALAGMVVLRGMMTFIRPPKVSMPSESGVTSSSTMFCTAPERMPAWMVAPRATASSGFCEASGSRRNISATNCADQRHARLAADEDDVVEIGGRELGIGERAQAMLARALDDGAGDAVEFRAGER